MYAHAHTHVLSHTLMHTHCRKLPSRLDSFKPDLVVYNAGTDILIGDSLGQLDITPEVSCHTERTPPPPLA